MINKIKDHDMWGTVYDSTRGSPGATLKNSTYFQVRDLVGNSILQIIYDIICVENRNVLGNSVGNSIRRTIYYI